MLRRMTTTDSASGRPAIMAGFTVALLAWGLGFYGPGVLLAALHERHGWPVATVSAAITVHFLSGAVLVARFPALQARLGLAWLVAGGGVLLALGIAAWSLVPQAWMLFPAALVSGAGWALTSGAAVNAIVAPWFERGRPAALSIAYTGASLGGVLFTPLWAVLVGALGLPVAGPLLAGLGICVFVVLGLGVLRRRPPAAGAAAPVARPLPAGRGIWADRRFATLSLAFSLAIFAQVGLIAHLFSLMLPAMGATGAGLAMSLLTACAVAGRFLLAASLPPGVDRRRAAALNFAVQVLGSLLLLAAGAEGVWLMLGGCVLFGLGVGNLISLPPLIAQSEFAPGELGRVVALVTAVNQGAYAFAPAVFGLLREATGGGGAVMVAAALLKTAAALIITRARPSPRSSTPPP